MGAGREEAYNGPLGKLSRLSGRGLLPPEGSPMVRKSQGLADTPEVCYLLEARPRATYLISLNFISLSVK